MLVTLRVLRVKVKWKTSKCLPLVTSHYLSPRGGERGVGGFSRGSRGFQGNRWGISRC